ncbi:Uncharacterised protein [Sphingobacterium daejeonense]|nr:Uncharacterised protein [Sphingobacterium daejeonense]
MNLINTDVWGVIAMFFMTIVIAIPLGKYIANVFSDKPGFFRSHIWSPRTSNSKVDWS